jgi:thiol-disulfide isomerase/thioredoxin
MDNRRGRYARLSVLGCLLALVAGAAQAQPAPGHRAPDITAGRWINSAPLNIDALRGRVVLVEFWTFGCYNCKNVIPALRDWHDRYANQGLTIVGVHCPEFGWEKPFGKVADAVRDLNIKYPIVQDNDYVVWNRYAVRAWPTLVLVDRGGVVRYRHIGEGAYAETEGTIVRLLAERTQ